MADLVLQLDPPVLRVLSLKKRDLHYEVPLDPGCVRAGVVEDAGVLREALRQPLQQLSLRGQKPKKAFVVLPTEAVAEQVVALPPLARADVRPAVDRVVREWLGPDAPPVIVRWRVVSRSQEEMRVYISAVRQDAVSSLGQVMSSSGLKVSGYLGLTQLLHAALPRPGRVSGGQNDPKNGGTLLVHASLSGQVAALLVRKKAPVWLWREDFLAGEDPVAALAEAAMSCQSEGFRFGRVLLSGAADNDEVALALADRAMEASPLSAWPWQVLGQAPTALKVDYGPGGGPGASRKTVAVAMAAVIVLEACSFAVGWSRAEGALAAAQMRLQSQTARVSEVQRAAEQVRQLRSQVAQVEEILKPPEVRPDWKSLYGVLSALAGTVALERIDASPGEGGKGWLVSLQGTGPSLGDVLNFARRLEAPPFSSPYLEQVGVGADGSASFRLKVRWAS